MKGSAVVLHVAIWCWYSAPKVVNGFSEFMAEVLGEKHARSAVGTNALPLNVPVEIEAIVEIRP